MAPDARHDPAMAAIESFMAESREAEEKAPQDFSNADAFFNLPDEGEDDDEDDN
jgi:uncharacterized protein